MHTNAPSSVPPRPLKFNLSQDETYTIYTKTSPTLPFEFTSQKVVDNSVYLAYHQNFHIIFIYILIVKVCLFKVWMKGPFRWLCFDCFILLIIGIIFDGRGSLVRGRSLNYSLIGNCCLFGVWMCIISCVFVLLILQSHLLSLTLT